MKDYFLYKNIDKGSVCLIEYFFLVHKNLDQNTRNCIFIFDEVRVVFSEKNNEKISLYLLNVLRQNKEIIREQLKCFSTRNVSLILDKVNFDFVDFEEEHFVKGLIQLMNEKVD